MPDFDRPFDQQPDDARSNANSLRVENQALAKGFTLIPNVILRARGLSRDAKMLYGILLSYAWQTDSCFPGYDRLMEDMQCQSQALSKYIKELKEAGLIEVQRRGQGMTSLYTLKDIQGENIQKFENQSASSLKIKELEVPESKTKNTQGKKHIEEDYSNIRKAPTQIKSGSDRVQPAHTASISRIRPVSTSDAEGAGDIPHKPPIPGGPQAETQSQGDMSRHGGMASVGDALLQRRRGRPSADEAEARRVIRQYVEDFGRELGDQAPRSSVTRAINLMQEAGVSLSLFISALQDARKLTQKRTASIQKQGAGGGVFPQKNKMAYFFSVLEDQLGLRAPTPIDAAGRSRPGDGSSRGR